MGTTRQAAAAPAMDAEQRAAARKAWENARDAALAELAAAGADITKHEAEETARRARLRAALRECEGFGVGLEKMAEVAGVYSKSGIRNMLGR